MDVIEIDPSAFRNARLAAHRTLAEVANIVGTSPSNLSRWERGIEIPKADSFIRWCAAIDDMLADPPVGMQI